MDRPLLPIQVKVKKALVAREVVGDVGRLPAFRLPATTVKLERETAILRVASVDSLPGV